MNVPAFEPRKLGGAASAHLDLIRAVAAWTVMWGHLRALFFVDFSHLQNASWFLKSIYFLTGFGHQAVMVFFVLSGFLISSTIISAHLRGTWSWREYAINRSTRLYVVLIPGLLLGLLLDFSGGTLFFSTGIYTHPIRNLGPAIAADNLTAGAFFGNLLFLQTILCPAFGSNGPLWSLANEFWYYVLFPVALSAAIALRKRRVTSGVFLTVLAIGLALFLGLDKCVLFLIWIAGCAVVFLYAGLRMPRKSWIVLYLLATSVGLCTCLIAARVFKAPVLGNDLGVGIAFALFLFGVLQVRTGESNSHYLEATRRLAGFSYSLYALHFPLLLFLRAWLVPAEGWQPTGIKMFYGSLIGLGVLVYAWLVSLFTENKTHQVRDIVRRAFR